jgi:hypothetical protein
VAAYTARTTCARPPLPMALWDPPQALTQVLQPLLLRSCLQCVQALKKLLTQKLRGGYASAKPSADRAISFWPGSGSGHDSKPNGLNGGVSSGQDTTDGHRTNGNGASTSHRPDSPGNAAAALQATLGAVGIGQGASVSCSPCSSTCVGFLALHVMTA